MPRKKNVINYTTLKFKVFKFLSLGFKIASLTALTNEEVISCHFLAQVLSN